MYVEEAYHFEFDILTFWSTIDGYYVSKTTYACCLLPDIYTFTDGQEDAKTLQGLLILAVFDKSEICLSSLNCDIDGVEIILELPGFVICICRVK